MSKNFASAVVVNYNAGRLLARCVEALISSTVRVEVIIVDNASFDNSLELLPADKVTLIKNNENLGFSKAVNLGAQKATTDHLVVVNPDCIVAANCIEQLIQELQHSETGLVGGLVLNPDGSEQRGCRRYEPSTIRAGLRVLQPVLKVFGKTSNSIDRTREAIPESPISVDAISGALFGISLSYFHELNGMDEGYFLHCEDLDLCRRVRNSGRKVKFHPHAIAVHQKSSSGGTNPTRVERFKHSGMTRYYRKFTSHGGLDPRFWFIWISVWVRWLCIALLNVFQRGKKSNKLTDSLSSINDFQLNTSKPILIILGASSQIGTYLLDLDSAKKYRILAVSRDAQSQLSTDSIWWIKPEGIASVIQFLDKPLCHWIHLAPIWLTASFSNAIKVCHPSRIVAVSSSSIITKKNSSSKKDLSIVQRLEEGESSIQQLSEELNNSFTIFRPTMIYGNTQNTNVFFLEKIIRRFGIFPIVGQGCGKRQPVHAEDIAKSCIDVIANKDTFNNHYILNGGETFTFKDLLTRIFSHTGRKTRFLRIPKSTLRVILSICSKIPAMEFLTADMVDRMDVDLAFDSRKAKTDFNYAPRKFELMRQINDRHMNG